MAELTRYLKLMWRAALLPSSVVTATEAAEALPGDPTAAGRWLRDRVRPCGTAVGEPVYLWGDVLHAMGVGPAPAAPEAEPIVTWKGVAAAVGVSMDTVARHRVRYHDKLKEPWFKDAAEAVAWWKALHAAPPARRTRQ